MAHKLPLHQLLREYESAVGIVAQLGYELEQEKELYKRPAVIQSLTLEIQHYVRREREPHGKRGI